MARGWQHFWDAKMQSYDTVRICARCLSGRFVHTGEIFPAIFFFC